MAYQYCKECGSLIKANDKCSNKNCKYGKRLVSLQATEKQLLYIESLYKQLGLNVEEIDRDMTKFEASKLIDQLQERIDLGIEVDEE